MSRQLITIQPDSLRWARERRGYSLDEAARRLSTSVERLETWEAGVEGLSPAKLREAADVYRISPAVFFLSDLPRESFTPPRDFRTVDSANAEHFSPKLREELERVRAQQDILRDLAALGSFSAPAVRFPDIIGLADERAARMLRQWLEIDDAAPPNLRDDRGLLRVWIAAVERKGVFVSQVSGIKVSEMRGCCLPDSNFPFIVLNGGDAVTGRLFTLAHEIVHLVLGDHCICNADPIAGSSHESRCNAIAAAMLMPKAHMLDHELVASATSTARWSIDQLERIGKDFGTSPEAVARRLLSLARMDAAEYARLRGVLRNRTGPSTSATGGPGYDVILLRNLGSEYVRRVITARNQRLISHSSVAHYLFSKLRWAEQMAAVLGLPYQ